MAVAIVDSTGVCLDQTENTPTTPDGDFEPIKNFPACPKFTLDDGKSGVNAIRFAQPLPDESSVQVCFHEE